MSSLILRHLSGSKANQESVFTDDELAAPITLGRDPANRLSFAEADDAASRHHARLERTAEGHRVIDLNSANGLFLNGARVAGESVVRHGDILQFGKGGPELSVKLDPPPVDQPKATRVVADYTPKATREVGPAGGATIPGAVTEPGASAGRVGRATVERMIGEEKQRSSRSVLNAVAAVLAVAFALGAWQYYESRKRDEEAEKQRVALEAQRKEAEKRAAELQARANLAGNVKQSYAAATVYLEVAWRLTATQTGKQIYHGRVNFEDKGKLPAYIKLENGSFEPLLVLDDTSGAKPISGTHTGSGFVVSDNGLILTNRHVAAAWYSTFDLEFPGVVVKLENGKLKPTGIIEQATTDTLRRWVPARSQFFNTQSVSDNRTVTGKVDAMMVTFPNSKLRVPATLGTISPEHDVALVKIDAAAGNLKKVELRDSYDTLKSGDQIVVLGYPGVSAKSYVITKSQD
ncbi:MAG TPA: FHA domain-containing protein, partial [Burkholderiaceae bacterium]|nr:FHA domain-containing protein [Burkholderiaceae bacterium]